MSEGRLLGAVLAGGASRRMGTDKAALAVGGRTMIERAVSALRPHCGETVVVSARPETPSGAWRVVADERPETGPLAGLEAALAEAGRSGCIGVAVLAVDLPLVGADAFGRLVDAWRREEGEAREQGTSLAVGAGRSGDPSFEPLCAVYAVGALEVASRLLDGGERAARALFETIGGRVVEGVAETGVNVNRPADLTRAEERLR